MVNITITDRDLQSFFKDVNSFSKKIQQALDHEVIRATYAVETRAKKEAPRGKGQLRSAIHHKIYAGKASGEVYVSTAYAGYVHTGTRPHEIRIRNKKVLAALLTVKNYRAALSAGKWTSKATVITSKGAKYIDRYQIFGIKVHHPGTKPNPFMQRAIDDERPIFRANIIKIFK